MNKKTKLIALFVILITVALLLGVLIIFNFLNKKKLVAFNASGADILLIQDLNVLLRNKGFEATIYRNKNEIDCKNIDYNIVFRGMFEYSESCTNSKHNILWQFYADLDKINGLEKMISIDEYTKGLIRASKKFDALIVASEKIYNLVKDKVNIPVYYIPQFTNQKKFYFEENDDVKSKVLFVGHPHFYRVAPLLALINNLPIMIYGQGWYPYFIENNKVRGYDIPHHELHTYYSSAEIVLQDTMPGMREFGFIPNRIYDVTASGGFVISDYIEEVEKIYGDSIPMWKNEKEFVKLINYYLSHPEKKAEKIKKAKEITLNNYTIDRTLTSLIKLLEDLK